MIKVNPVSKQTTTGQEIGRMKGPIKGRNWFSTDNPSYLINQNGNGVVTLQGTNNIALGNDLRDNTNFSPDLLPAPGATWTVIAIGNGNLSGTFVTEFQFLQLVVSTPGTGTVTQAWVVFN